MSRSAPWVFRLGVVAGSWPVTAFAGPPPPPPPAGTVTVQQQSPDAPPAPPPDVPKPPPGTGAQRVIPVGPSVSMTPPAATGPVQGAQPLPPPPSPAARPLPRVTDPAGPPSETDMSPTTDLSRHWGYSQGKPVDPLWVDRKPETQLASPNPIGFYSGVTVAGENLPPIPAPVLGTTPSVITWTGFQPPSPRGTAVFFQLSAPVDPRMERDGLTLRVHLPNTTVNVKNNARPLDLRYFRTPARMVTIDTHPTETVVTIALKRDAEPTLQTVPAKNGYSMLVVQFPVEVEDGSAATTPPPPSPSSPP